MDEAAGSTTGSTVRAPGGPPNGDAVDRAFDRAFEGLRATGASPDIAQLVELLARHGSEEGKLLAVYEELVKSTSNKAVQYLVNLVLDDERRHHRLLADMANAMAWESLNDDDIPVAPTLSPHADRALVEHTRKLRRAEREDHKQLRDLRRRLRPYADTTMWALIVDLMVLDTEKHMTILRFIEQRARGN
ncbi:MAG: hypothetical protein ACYCU7_18130 [Acidimicrobiales bacterium]